MPNRRNFWAAVLSCAVLLLACGSLEEGGLAIEPVGVSRASTSTAGPEQAVEGEASQLPYPESIVIEEPGAGSRLVGSVRLRGLADPTHEQHLGMRLLVPQGEIVAEGSTIINAPLGERGPFAGRLSFSVDQERPALVQVFATSARDGKFTHMASNPVTLAPSGETEIERSEARSEKIVVLAPQAGERVADGTAMVRGRALGLRQNALTIEVQNSAGEVVGSETVTIETAAGSAPTEFELAVEYRVETAGAGRIVVSEPSSTFGRAVHISAVEVELQP